jgi:hypothetical protein
MAEQDGTTRSNHEGPTPIGERERLMIERSMAAYASHVRSVVRFQRAVVEFRRSRSAHEALHDSLAMLARSRQAAADCRADLHSAVRAFVHVLRADARPPEMALGMTKRAMSAIVVAMPAGEAITDTKPLMDDVVRWAIEAYYDAA